MLDRAYAYMRAYAYAWGHVHPLAWIMELDPRTSRWRPDYAFFGSAHSIFDSAVHSSAWFHGQPAGWGGLVS